MQNKFDIYNETKNIPITDWDFLYEKFLQIKNKILSKNFDLSVSILNPKNSLKLNKKQRKQNYIPNTLSFKYSPNSGEIILTPEIIMKENYHILGAPPSPTERAGVRRTFQNKIIYLFIHSCLHLTNLDHGSKMDKLEKKYLKEFII